jgi:hypothetical protein
MGIKDVYFRLWYDVFSFFLGNLKDCMYGDIPKK